MSIGRTFQIRAGTKSMAGTKSIAMRILPAALLLSLFAGSTPSPAADFPEAEISNGQLTAKIYLPDAKSGYYRSTRFDWSGALYSLQYKGHEFYGTWYDRIDPKVINWVFEGEEIVSGPCSALAGPVDEFQTPLGWDEAQPAEPSSSLVWACCEGVRATTTGSYRTTC